MSTVRSCARAGELIASTVDLLLGVAGDAATREPDDVVLDLTEVTRIGSETVAALHYAQHDHPVRPARLWLRVPARLRARMSVCTLDSATDAGETRAL
jgi:anti-anti-sigma regulatory factor